MSQHHVYFSPGMFGFGRVGSYNYFAHVERELTARFAAAGQELIAHVIDDLPTASIRRRACRLAEVVAHTSTPDAAIHLLGHSTGGLDARLVASPATQSIPSETLAWLPRLRSVTTMNTPHYGTPLASFFVTAQGQRALAALSMLTVAGLTLGVQPLRASSVILGLLRRGDRPFPFKQTIVDRAIESLVGLADDVSSPALRTFVAAIEDDQGALLQVSPESMDLVAAGLEDRPSVRYQATASMARPPGVRRWADTIGHPWRALSLAMFTGLHRITATTDDDYPCVAPENSAPSASEADLALAFDGELTAGDNDGVVPIRSQLRGTLVWAGLGDHLDVLGHFRDDREDVPAELAHIDWLTSGSAFTPIQFAALIDAIATGMLEASSGSTT